MGGSRGGGGALYASEMQIKMFKTARSTQQLKQPLTKSPAGYCKKFVHIILLQTQPAAIQTTISPYLADQAASFW